jgi:hypothetical protein
VANTDAILRFDGRPGQTRLQGPGVKVTDLPAMTAIFGGRGQRVSRSCDLSGQACENHLRRQGGGEGETRLSVLSILSVAWLSRWLSRWLRAKRRT